MAGDPGYFSPNPAGASIEVIAPMPHRGATEVNGVKIVDANLEEHKDRASKHLGLLREMGQLGVPGHDGRAEFRKI